MKQSLLILSFLFASCGLKEAKVRDEQQIKALIAQRGPELNVCYEQALRKNPKLPSGTLTVRADQHIDGGLHSTRLIKGFAASHAVMDCVASKVNSWKTQPLATRGPIDITWTFSNTQAPVAEAQKDFGEMLKLHEPDFKACFTSYLGQTEKPEWGKIRFQFLRQADGRIENLKKIEGFKGSDRVFQCMADIMKDWRLKQTAETVPMTWSYNFHHKLD